MQVELLLTSVGVLKHLEFVGGGHSRLPNNGLILAGSYTWTRHLWYGNSAVCCCCCHNVDLIMTVGIYTILTTCNRNCQFIIPKSTTYVRVGNNTLSLRLLLLTVVAVSTRAT
eukprot:GHVS01106382.1.p1 GENE.GHVS01106382.1~~GHVS01106382.1.p1  ORF type:complete len:113 (-),score=14.31 GHVS01106382.1:49-387(-)